MPEWTLHTPISENQFHAYRCGLVAGQRVKLRKDLVVLDHENKPSGKTHRKGDEWIVLPGILADPVLWFRQSDGARCTWDDDAGSVEEWFDVVDARQTG